MKPSRAGAGETLASPLRNIGRMHLGVTRGHPRQCSSDSMQLSLAPEAGEGKPHQCWRSCGWGRQNVAMSWVGEEPRERTGDCDLGFPVWAWEVVLA